MLYEHSKFFQYVREIQFKQRHFAIHTEKDESYVDRVLTGCQLFFYIN